MRFKELIRRDGWLLGALIICVLLCLLLPSGSTSAMTQEEQRLARVLSAMEGAGTVEAAIYYEETEQSSVPCGAVIVADGAENMAVRLRLTRAVTALLGIESGRVEVFQREGGLTHE